LRHLWPSAEPKWNLFVDGRAARRRRWAAAFAHQPGSISPEPRQKGSIMSALIGILITFLVVILVLYLVNMLPIEGRAKHIVRIIVIIIGILSLLKYLGVWI
jgi:hypothetical protein